jgi:hypothetical protein
LEYTYGGGWHWLGITGEAELREGVENLMDYDSDRVLLAVSRTRYEFTGAVILIGLAAESRPVKEIDYHGHVHVCGAEAVVVTCVAAG